MPTLTIDELLNRIAPIFWETLLEAYRPDCCIAACSYLKKIFNLYGYTAEPLPVSVAVFNAEAAHLLHHNRIPEDFNSRKRLYQITGAWSVGIIAENTCTDVPITSGGKGGAFHGHLILRVNNTLLIDGSLKQADRPQHRIVLPPLIVIRNVPDEFWRAEQRAVAEVNNCFVSYEQIHNDRYLSAPDWTRTFPKVLNKIISRIEHTAASTCLTP